MHQSRFGIGMKQNNQEIILIFTGKIGNRPVSAVFPFIERNISVFYGSSFIWHVRNKHSK